MRTLIRSTATMFGLAVAALAAGCDGPPVNSTQQGYRGTGMAQIDSPRILRAKDAENRVPKADPLAKADGPRASAEYKNVPVLGGLSTDEFNRLMLAITEWVSPDEGCAYCHKVENMASDEVPTKIVARRMFQMTNHINTDWKSHVAETGVTCYTCHRGNPVPKNIWFNGDTAETASMYAGNRAGQNAPSKQVGLSSLPNDPFTPFLEYAENIRLASADALPDPSSNRATIQRTEQTYGLMMHMSTALGVNCTFCHNSRSFSNWEESNVQRVPAWHGIRMVRGLNMSYINPLKANFAPERLGPTGDTPKLNCATCHQGVNKPLNGVSMLKDYPELSKAKK